MVSRFRFALALASTFALILVIPVFAGGWAVITLDELPTGVVAGEPFDIGFTVLQHGRTPLSGLDPTITATFEKKEQFVVHAVEAGEPGHYTATITFPKEGNWEWTISAFTMEQPMPALQVAAGNGSPAVRPVVKLEPVPFALSPLWMVRILALVIGIGGAWMMFRSRSRLAYGLVMLSLGVGVGSFVTGPAVPEVEAESKPVVAASGASSLSQVELGQQLFIAKGCITCHVNRRVPNHSVYWTIDMGAPDLSVYASDPQLLRTRLKDPTAVKADTQMPNLNLDEAEIEALVAFINSK